MSMLEFASEAALKAHYRAVRARVMINAPTPKREPIVVMIDPGQLWVSPLLVEVKQIIPSSVITKLKRLVCFRFNIELAHLMSPDRSAKIAMARQIGIYLTRENTCHSWLETARRWGRSDHTTALHAWRKITKLRPTDPELDATLTELEAELQT